MSTIILNITIPDKYEAVEHKAWTDAKEGIPEIIGKDKNQMVLSENTFLFYLPENFSVFVDLVSRVQSFGLSYQVLFFEKHPLWEHYS